jgi:hypothetical protein
MSSSTIRHYLDKPPYYGRSAYAHLGAVKHLCGPTCTYDPVRKLWGTKCTDALRALVRSGKWYPVGIEHEWKGQFLRATEAHREAAEAAWVAKQQAEADAKAAAVEAAAAEAAAAKRRNPASWVIPGSKPKRPKVTRAPTPAPTPPPAPAPASATPKSDGHLEPTAAEVAECARLGFTQQAIEYSVRDLSLGPRMSLSAEARLLRWCALRFEHEEPVDELTREERRASWSYECRYPLPEAASRDFAAELNREAAEHAAALV